MTGTFIVIFAVIVAIWAAWVAWQVAKEGGHNPYHDSNRDNYQKPTHNGLFQLTRNLEPQGHAH
jgi:uncharacterized protein YxeA